MAVDLYDMSCATIHCKSQVPDFIEYFSNSCMARKLTREMYANHSPMNLSDQTLVKKLAIVLVLKLAVLVALWWFFVRDQRVPVDSSSVASQFLTPDPTSAKESKP
jgi:hypothetical protein